MPIELLTATMLQNPETQAVVDSSLLTCTLFERLKIFGG
jgi:hypothetical protein